MKYTNCEEALVKSVFLEENGAYSIDCRAAVWATDKMHVLLMQRSLMRFVQWKKKISIITRKFYDSLHYLRLLDKNKLVQYIYILEYPNGDVTTRKRLRNRLKDELPFSLQENIGNGRRLIDRVDVLSIDEWNADSDYGKFPIKRV